MTCKYDTIVSFIGTCTYFIKSDYSENTSSNQLSKIYETTLVTVHLSPVDSTLNFSPIKLW